mgnify:CR=1 FL=1
MPRKEENYAQIFFVRESLYPRNLIFALGVRETLSRKSFYPRKLLPLKYLRSNVELIFADFAPFKVAMLEFFSLQILKVHRKLI